MSGKTVNLAKFAQRQKSDRAAEFGLKPDALQGGEELPGILITGYTQIGQFLALRVEEQDGGRAEQLIARQQGLVILAVGGNIGLQQHGVFQLGLHFGVAEAKAFHFLAGDAPVSVKVNKEKIFF